MLVKHGGHAGAAGLSLMKSDLEAFKERMHETGADFEAESVSDIYYDLEIKATEIPEVIEQLAKFEPFGEGNAPIVFKVNGFSTIPKYGAYKKFIGEDESTVKLFSSKVTAVGFGMAEKLKAYPEPKVVNMTGVLSTNWFGGNGENQIEFSDIEVVSKDFISTLLADRLKAMASA